MATFTRGFKRVISRGERSEGRTDPGADARVQRTEVPPIDIPPDDPIITYFQGATGAVDIETLELDSPAREALVAAGMRLVVPLVSQGELIGLLNLGPRLSERDYSGDDRKLLDNLAAHAAPAVRVAQLVRQQEAEVRTRERLEQELRVAQLIQQQFLPKELPQLPGWQVAAYYRPARQVGGDFYDFFDLDDGKIGIVVGDVTDKGVPAALVMATTHSILRSEGPRLVSPSQVLKRANDLLYPDIPAHMFVTCLYAVLDPATGHVVFANAGHNLPYVRTADGVQELRATGMPLGLMPDMEYEEKEAVLAPGEHVLLHSDGLVEAHNPSRQMFGFPRLMEMCNAPEGGNVLIDRLLAELDQFTGAAWEQEDDITLVTLGRADSSNLRQESDEAASAGESDKVLTQFDMPSEQGNERLAMERVADALAPLALANGKLERLKTAVAEATMNAIEHGNNNDADKPVSICVVSRNGDVAVRITDQGGAREIAEAETPDIEAKLAGLQSPRGWGLFLIKNMVDDMRVWSDDLTHTVE
ncbi:MAG: SpoIIE family protein phosphatase, partial [Actinomycetota bacterium]|nr:SpoIIE family protein phosphatase [Actinomycetota bacterium]